MKIKNKKIYFLSIILFSFFRISIYNFRDYPYYEITNFILILFLLLIIFNTFINIKKIKLYSYLLLVMFILDNIYLKNFISTFINSIFILIFLNLDFKKKINFYNLLYNIIFIICIFSLIEYICFLLGKDTTISIITTDVKQKINFYYSIGYFNSILFNLETGYKLKRMLSIFNEPGSLGTILGMFILFIDIKKHKFKNIIIILAGILSFSTAFFYFLGLKLFIESFKNKIKFLIYILILIIFSFLLIKLPNEYNKNMSQIYLNTVYKYQNIVNKIKNKEKLRTSEEDKLILKEFYRNENIIIGKRKKSNFKDLYNIDLLIYEGGILKILLILNILILSSSFFTIKNKKIKILTLIAYSSILQRPNILDASTLMIISTGPYYYYYYQKYGKKV